MCRFFVQMSKVELLSLDLIDDFPVADKEREFGAVTPAAEWVINE